MGSCLGSWTTPCVERVTPPISGAIRSIKKWSPKVSSEQHPSARSIWESVAVVQVHDFVCVGHQGHLQWLCHVLQKVHNLKQSMTEPWKTRGEVLAPHQPEEGKVDRAAVPPETSSDHVRNSLREHGMEGGKGKNALWPRICRRWPDRERACPRTNATLQGERTAIVKCMAQERPGAVTPHIMSQRMAVLTESAGVCLKRAIRDPAQYAPGVSLFLASCSATYWV